MHGSDPYRLFAEAKNRTNEYRKPRCIINYGIYERTVQSYLDDSIRTGLLINLDRCDRSCACSPLINGDKSLVQKL